MTDKTSASLFTGGGGFEIGAMMAGYRPVWGVEIRPDIAAVAERNIPGLRVIVSDVAAVDYSALPKVDHLHASPSCKKASIANSDGGECEEDIAAAEAVCRAIREVSPDSFTLENVWQYRDFKSFKLIVGQLTKSGYKVDWWHLNSADYGVAQTRKRLILIARKDRQPTHPQPTHSKTPDSWGIYKPWVGWLESIADLVDTLPESEFAPWQLERLPAELRTCLVMTGNTSTKDAQPGGGVIEASSPAHTVLAQRAAIPRAYLLNRNKSERDDHYKPESDPAYTVCVESAGRQRAFIVDMFNTGRELSVREEAEPFTTVFAQQFRRPSTIPKAITGGRVVKMTPRALARFQSFPDDYVLPETLTVWTSLDPSNGLACEIIGNAVAPLLAKAICDSLR